MALEGKKGGGKPILRAASLFTILFGFWLLLSGRADLGDAGDRYLLGAGILASLLVTFVATRKGILDPEGHPIESALGIFLYLPWLFVQIVRANLDVAYRIWHPRRPISPRLVRIPYKTRTDLGTVIYANSITLTPGTVTVRIDPERREFLVHALTEKAARELQGGEMERRVRIVEGEE